MFLVKIPLVIVLAMFPAKIQKNVEKNLPYIWEALEEAGMADQDMGLMALSTIRAETENFIPISEFQSTRNTLFSPFDKYEKHRLAKRLGNLFRGDGAKYRGRGFIQLTGRNNYKRMGELIGIDLINHPERANDPKIAAKILVAFLKDKEPMIRVALERRDLRTARKLVNGGVHGLDKFVKAFRLGEQLLNG